MGVDNAALARRYMTELWGKNNENLIDELVDDEILLRDPMTPDGVRGKAEVRKRVNGMTNMFENSSITIRDVIVSGDRVVVTSTWRGTHKGDFYGVKGTGKTVNCESVDVLRMKNGKVVENESFFDSYSMLQQMGALPPLEQFKPRENQATSQTATA